ncbi:hypothetical protein B296_00048604 [Ensete ventricosum]|uniref:Uncharacterized protein n=1 Tax=Ensete ventricosum TaxID=4639 RepID=A0A426WXP5_ENSVE|nr:hypothetical protein B296_00048604 [Ensete ventricosum]
MGGASGHTTDLTQVRSTPPTYKRTPHRKDGMVDHKSKAERVYKASTKFSPNILALEGGPMSSECPFGDSGTERRTEPDHPRPTEEATTAVPTPNRFWRMMTDLGFPLLASNLTPLMVTAEAFLSLTS